ncbi:MAG: GNAT family N-acetyltransferase [Trueperaceae bacterium]
MSKFAKPNIVNNPAQKRFEVQVDDALAALYYTVFEDKLYLEHTEVPVALQGRGLAGQLVEAALEHAKTNKTPIIPMCPYANKFIQRRPEYQTLLGAPEVK